MGCRGSSVRIRPTRPSFPRSVVSKLSQAISVYIVAADMAAAERIAEALVDERLAACVNILGSVRSVYRWKGAVERADEVAMIAKTTQGRFESLAARMRALHSYDTPAIVAWPIVAGDAAYLDWIAVQTTL
jgi:periplasmic divalent cation tolerance protein